MHWLLQSNLSTEAQLAQYAAGLDQGVVPLGATWSYIKLVPFAGDVIPDDDYTGRAVFALGSTSLILAAQKRGWSPGVVYDAALFRYEAWLKGLGRQNLLNGDGEVMRFGDGIGWLMGEKVFIRPCEDLKAFTGEVISIQAWQDWQRRVREGEVSTRALQLSSDTPVVVAPVKAVLREWRFFVVGGKVITGSQYRTMYGKAVDADVPKDVWGFAQRMVDLWPMAPCYCLDVGEISEGLKVIEINCFNGSGLYACDAAAAFAAVERLYQP